MVDAPVSECPSWLAGGGEMGARMRAKDWSSTPLGAAETWSESIKIAVSICLNARFPILLWLGSELRLVYNDAYIPFLGEAKHPKMLGAPGREAWGEIWATIGPMHDEVKAGRATSVDDLQMFFARRLPREEVYVTFGYSPILAADGQTVEGVFCACTETTQRIVSERRLATLRDLGDRSPDHRTAEVACRDAAAVLHGNPLDIPFAAIYLLDEQGRNACRVATARLNDGATAFPAVHAIAEDSGAVGPWPLRQVAENGRPLEVFGLPGTIGVFAAYPWPDAVETAFVLPLAGPTRLHPAGFLIIGVSPRRPLDSGYRSFFELVARHIATSIADARAFEAERKRAEALAELDRAKTAFFSNVSHEFRTPLTLMLSPLEEALANSDGISPANHSLLEIARRNALRLLRLVNTLLDFSRVEAGRVQASYEPVELATLTADIASNFRSACERAGLSLLVDCDPLDELAYVDREMWEKIVLNLISNAFKFTLRGRIEVSMRAEASKIRLAVTDTGVGIPGAELLRVFERFHRIEGQHGRNHEGTGIGLALVQELVRLHGGDIAVESSAGQGTTFTVTIPTGRVHLPAEHINVQRTLTSTSIGPHAFVEEALRWLPSADRDSVPEAVIEDVTSDSNGLAAEGRRDRILLADDNADMRDYLARLLVGAGYDVEAVADGELALAAAARHMPDLVLADVMMPRLDGFGLLSALRTDPKLRDTPAIMLSARAGAESRVEGLAGGADDYLVKPFSARELLARVRSSLLLSHLRAEELASMARLQELSLRLTARPDLPSLLQEVLDAAMELQGADCGDVQLYDESTRTLRIVAHRNLDQQFLDYFATVDASDSSACALALREGRRIIIEDVNTNEAFAPYRRVTAAAGIRGVQSTPLFDPSVGKPLGMLSTHFHKPYRPAVRDLHLLDLYARQAGDVIASRISEQHLRESEARLQAAIDLVGLGCYSWNPQTDQLRWDDTVRAMWGLPAGASIDREIWFAAVHPEDRALLQEAVDHCIDPAGDGVYNIEYRVIGVSDGIERWVSTFGRTIFEEGRPVGFFGAALDITDRKRSEEALRQSEFRLASILEQLPAGVGLFDRAGRLRQSNTALRRFVGGDWLPSKDANVGGRWRAFRADGSLLEPSDYPGTRALSGETVIPGIDFLHTLEDGRQIWTRMGAGPFRDESGRIMGAVTVVQDISLEKHAAQMNLLLIAELQHRTRNLLAVVSSLVEETLASCSSVDEFAVTLRSRLAALSRVQGLLSRDDNTAITIGELVRLELSALGAEPADSRVSVRGPNVPLPRRSVQILALSLHELGTNARKYGALRSPDGRLIVTWNVIDRNGRPRLVLEWREMWPPQGADAEPVRKGFGRALIEELLPVQLDAQTQFELKRGELRCSVTMAV